MNFSHEIILDDKDILLKVKIENEVELVLKLELAISNEG